MMWQIWLINYFSWFSDIDISQVSTVMHLRCDKLLNNLFDANFLKNVTVKEFRNDKNSLAYFFDSQCTEHMVSVTNLDGEEQRHSLFNKSLIVWYVYFNL